MPYINKDRRQILDQCINMMCLSLKGLVKETPFSDEVSNEEFLALTGDINYCFSRVISKVMGNVSYSKIAVATGVLENIKQEFYRRVAEKYEDLKIKENEDIPEYR